MGEVILGLPGPWANDKSEASDHYTTKIGGLPDWPIPSASIRSDMLVCNTCGRHLALLSQVYAPVSSSTVKFEERAIYVFGCVMTKCLSSPVSWRAFRVQKPMHNEKLIVTSHEVIPPTISAYSAPISSHTEDLWTFDTSGNDGEEGDDINLEELSRAFSEAASLTSSPKKQNKIPPQDAIVESSTNSRSPRVTDTNIPVLPCFYIYTQEEALSKESTSKHTNYVSLSMKENLRDLDSNVAEETWEMESYEYDRALHADRTYLKFKKRMDAYPEQCFRYSYGGKPLLANGGAAVLETCKLCGGLRHYEMQLMPPLLYFLQEENLDCKDHSLENWNWMTLIVYTCAASCSKPNQETSGGWTFAEEEIVVQYE